MTENIIKCTAVSGKYTKNGTPNGVTSITPFITVNDPSEAIEFYTIVFNAKMKNIAEHPDGNDNKMIVHAELDFGNGFLQLGAANPAYQLALPPDENNACYSLGIHVNNVDQVFENAVSRGAKEGNRL